VKVLIIDDEPLARTHLRRLLDSLDQTVIGEAEDPADGLRMAASLQPDLVLLDIRMPEITGLQIAAALQSLPAAPLVTFVTGFSEHALAAFEKNAMDYLLKPVMPERLAASLARARLRLANRVEQANTPAGQNADAPRAPGEEGGLQPLDRLPIRENYAIRFIRVEDISYAIARDKRVIIFTNDGDNRTYYTVSQLERLLPSDRFLRIHESCIVSISQIKELNSLGSHAYSVTLISGVQLPVSRARFPELRRRLGLGFLPAS